MTAPTVASSVQGSALSNQGVSLAPPSGTEPRDLLVASVVGDGSLVSGYPVSGWQILQSYRYSLDFSLYIMYMKVPLIVPTSWVFPNSGSGNSLVSAGIARVINACPYIPFAGVTLGPATHTAPEAESFADDSLLLGVFGQYTSGGGGAYSWTAPSGMTEVFDSSGNGGNSSQEMARLALSSKGVTGTKVGAPSSSATRKASSLIVINPSGMAGEIKKFGGVAAA